MKTGEIVYARTHAELLNELLGTSYSGWMKSSIMLPEGERLWMIQLGDFVASSGWRNQLVSEDRIVEEQISELQFKNNGTVVETGKYDEDRVVFDFDKKAKNRKYIFRGVFRINRALSSNTKNVWDKITDEYLIGNNDACALDNIFVFDKNDENVNEIEGLLPETFDNIYNTIKEELKNSKDHISNKLKMALADAHDFLMLYADTMLYGPSKATLDNMCKIWVDESIKYSAILYQPIIESRYIVAPAGILLALDANGQYRFFSIEYSFPMAVCEYDYGKHLNYGQVKNIKEALKKINGYLDCTD